MTSVFNILNSSSYLSERKLVKLCILLLKRGFETRFLSNKQNNKMIFSSSFNKVIFCSNLTNKTRQYSVPLSQTKQQANIQFQSHKQCKVIFSSNLTNKTRQYSVPLSQTKHRANTKFRFHKQNKLILSSAFTNKTS